MSNSLSVYDCGAHLS